MVETTRAAMSLPHAQAADVNVAAAAGRDVVTQGLDGEKVVDLLGRRLAGGLDRIGTVLTWFLIVASFQTAALLLLVALALLALLGEPQLAGR